MLLRGREPGIAHSGVRQPGQDLEQNGPSRAALAAQPSRGRACWCTTTLWTLTLSVAGLRLWDVYRRWSLPITETWTASGTGSTSPLTATDATSYDCLVHSG